MIDPETGNLREELQKLIQENILREKTELKRIKLLSGEEKIQAKKIFNTNKKIFRDRIKEMEKTIEEYDEFA
ncbi:MAG: hypothetical protein R3Y65_03180 [Bacillota bacterium]